MFDEAEHAFEQHHQNQIIGSGMMIDDEMSKLSMNPEEYKIDTGSKKRHIHEISGGYQPRDIARKQRIPNIDHLPLQ